MTDSTLATYFPWRVRVYYEDTDAGGIVYYANYLRFFERARTEWLRALGLDQHDLMQQTGAAFVVRHVTLDYQMPARLDDEIEIRTAIEKIGRASLKMTQSAYRLGDTPTLLVAGHVTLACIDIQTFRPRPMPETVLQRIQDGI